MTRNTRIVLLVAAVAVVIAAVAIIGSGGSNDSSTTTTAAQTTSSGGKSVPAIQTIQISKGKPVGGVQKITVKNGGVIRFRVHSDASHDIHVHGFNILRHVNAGGTLSYAIKSNAAGLYEVEIEETSTQIGLIKVEP